MKRGQVPWQENLLRDLSPQQVLHRPDSENRTVYLNQIGSNIGQVLTYLKDLTGLPAGDLEDMVGSLPCDVAKTGDYGAQRIKQELKRLGYSAEIK